MMYNVIYFDSFVMFGIRYLFSRMNGGDDAKPQDSDLIRVEAESFKSSCYVLNDKLIELEHTIQKKDCEIARLKADNNSLYELMTFIELTALKNKSLQDEAAKSINEVRCEFDVFQFRIEKIKDFCDKFSKLVDDIYQAKVYDISSEVKDKIK